MTRTEILGLAKREPDEKYNLEQNNANMDIIDTFADILVQATPTVPATAEGNAIVLNNSSDKELAGLTIYGNTTQSGTPTPEAPVDLDSVENPIVTIGDGKNQSQTISVPYILNGVGDVRDYVDFEKSVIVKKTETYQLTSAMTWAKNSANTRIYTILPDGIEKATNSTIYCSHGIKGSWTNSTSGTVCLGNSATPVCGFATSDFATVEELKSWLDSQTDGVFIVVPLITPTETPLTAEEIEAFKQLQSYYPTTTITNSEGAEMGVEYKADTKTVLKEKLDKFIMR